MKTLTSPPFSQIRNHIHDNPEQHGNFTLNKEQFKVSNQLSLTM